jgi:probable phosphoglycerate mutase
MRILLIRHGQEERGYRGGWSQRGMTEEGFAQACALATHPRVHWQPIHLILSSDLRRAAATTAEILKGVQAHVRYAPEWREMNNGELAGMPTALAEARDPSLYGYWWRIRMEPLMTLPLLVGRQTGNSGFWRAACSSTTRSPGPH